MRRQILFSAYVLNLTFSTTYADPFGMTWSGNTFGYDGPWQAVQVKVGSPGQTINLFPGGNFASHLLNISACVNPFATCYQSGAGLYDPGSSKTADTNEVRIDGPLDYTASMVDIQGSGQKYVIDQVDIGGGLLVPSVSLTVHGNIFTLYPDGSSYPITVGVLSLGTAGTVNQSFTRDGGPPFNASLIPGYLSPLVVPKLAGSLYFGGYDQNRVIGDILTQPRIGSGSPQNINLRDISINVVKGGSPWNFTTLSGLLSSGNSSMGNSLLLQINPTAPYLNLPKSTCDAIAAQLPVSYQPKYGLYFWNTNDPQYTAIVTSPSVLTFTFIKDLSNTKVVNISVPFRLLNLTLTAPLTSYPTPYFPCNAASQGIYGLGRAFLQAAFFGANWDANSGTWFLAQAPGPNIIPQPNVVPMLPTDSSIQSSANDWTVSWDGNWTPLPSNFANPTNPLPSSLSTSTSTPFPNTGLPTGAKAGIAVGVVVAAALLGSAFFIFHRRRSRARNQRSGHKDAGGLRSSSAPLTELPMELDGRPGMAPEIDGREIHGGLYEMAPEEAHGSR